MHFAYTVYIIIHILLIHLQLTNAMFVLNFKLFMAMKSLYIREGLVRKKKCEIFTQICKEKIFQYGGGTPLPESPKILDMLGKNLEIFLSFMDL